MSNQNFNNHRRYHPIYHIFLFTILVITLIGVAVLLIKEGLSYSTFVISLIFIYLAVNFVLTRSYPLKVQDRVIKAEENLRYYVMKGQLLDPRLTIAQIAALRFASDEEYLDLSEKAASQNLSPDDIKKAIKTWKSDHYRV